jgi:phage shock protein A
MWQSLLNLFAGKPRPETDPRKVLALALQQVAAAGVRVRAAHAQAEARRAEIQATLQMAEAQMAQVWEEAKQAHRKGNTVLANSKMQAKVMAEAKTERLGQLFAEAAQHEHTLRQQLAHLQLQAEELKNKESMLATRLASAETLAELHQKLDQLGATAQVEALEDAVNQAETFYQLLNQELGTSATGLNASLQQEVERERQKAEAELAEAEFARISKLFANTPEKLAQFQHRQKQLAHQQGQAQQKEVEAFFAQTQAPEGLAKTDGLPPDIDQFFGGNESVQKKIDDFFNQ